MYHNIHLVIRRERVYIIIIIYYYYNTTVASNALTPIGCNSFTSELYRIILLYNVYSFEQYNSIKQCTAYA